MDRSHHQFDRRGRSLVALAAALVVVVGAPALSGCARHAHRVVDRAAPVAVRAGALHFNGPRTQEKLEKQGAGVDVLHWEYARNNDAISATTHTRTFHGSLYQDSEWYGQPAPAARYRTYRPGAPGHTTPILSPARERWFNPPY